MTRPDYNALVDTFLAASVSREPLNETYVEDRSIGVLGTEVIVDGPLDVRAGLVAVLARATEAPE